MVENCVIPKEIHVIRTVNYMTMLVPYLPEKLMHYEKNEMKNALLEK